MLSIGSKVRDLTIEALIGETPRLRLYRASGAGGDRLIGEVRAEVSDMEELKNRVDAWATDDSARGLGLPTELIRSGESTLLLAELRSGDTWREAQPNLQETERLCWLGRAVDTVAALHQRRIVHGELGPDTFALTSAGKVSVLMPGVADLLDVAAGGEAWTEPEIAAGASPTMASDVFALGVLAAALAGQDSDPGNRRARRAIAAGRQPWPQFEPVSGWPPETAAVMNGALCSRGVRPSNAVVLRAVLRSQPRQSPLQHTPRSLPAVSAKPRRVKQKKRRKIRIPRKFIAAAAALAAVVLLGLWTTNRPYRPTCADDSDCAVGLTCEGALCRAEGMAYLPAATFEVGELEQSPDELTDPYEVRLTYGFYIDRHEVTQREFREVTGTSPSWSGECGDACPVESTNWYEAVTYANRRSVADGLPECYRLVDCRGDFGVGCPDLEPGTSAHECMGSFQCARVDFVGLHCAGYRLPTEVEWEYAARGGTTESSYAGTIIPFGGEGATESLERLAGIARTSESAEVDFPGAWPCSQIEGASAGQSCGPGRVGSLAPNAYGLHDMLGNVGEWMHDAPEADPASMSGWRCFGRSTVRSTGESSCRRARVVDRTHYTPEGTVRMLRGGAWFHSAPGSRVTQRSRLRTRARFVDVGFRLVRTASPPG